MKERKTWPYALALLLTCAVPRVALATSIVVSVGNPAPTNPFAGGAPLVSGDRRRERHCQQQLHRDLTSRRRPIHGPQEARSRSLGHCCCWRPVSVSAFGPASGRWHVGASTTQYSGGFSAL
jgi:hypothetical protein